MNDVRITGLAGSEVGDNYLAKTYGLIRVENVGGIPVYKNEKRELFVGGYKGIYSVVVSGSQKLIPILEEWRKDHTFVRYSFSANSDFFRSTRLNLMLELAPGIKIEDRLIKYARNVRKHVRRVEESSLEYKVEPPPDEWYRLYSAHCDRLGSISRPLESFKTLERVFGPAVVCMVAYDGGLAPPVGALYCLRTDTYLTLWFIASDIAYRNVRVDNGLYDMAVQYAIREGIRFVDFGPTMRTDVSHLDMKAGYGVQVFYFADKAFIPITKRLDEQARHLVYRINRRVQTIWNRFMTH